MAIALRQICRGAKMSSDVLNGICPYYTMYPLAFPLGVLKRHGRAGEWVLDPFCGRGTTNFAARMRAMPSYGIDSSPVAAALAEAKIARATAEGVIAQARSILLEPRSRPSHKVSSGGRPIIRRHWLTSADFERVCFCLNLHLRQYFFGR